MAGLLRLAPWAVLLACIGCGVPRQSSDALYRSAERNLREGRLGVAAQQAEEGIRIASSRDGEAGSRLRLLQVEILLAQGDAERSTQLLNRFPSTSENPEIRSKRCLLLVNAWMKRGDLTRARDVMTECRAALNAQPQSPLSAEAGVVEGLLLINESRYDKAGDTLRAAIAQAERQGDPYWKAAALINLGFASLSRSRYDEAILLLEPAVVTATECGAQRFVEWGLINLGICRYRMGDFEGARRDLERAEKINQLTGDRSALQASLGEMANLAMFENRPREAASLYERAFRAAEALGLKGRAALWAENMSAALIQTGEWAAAEPWNDKALANYGARIDSGPLARCQRNAAAIAAGRRQYADAERIYTAALRTSTGNPILEWETHADLAGLLARQGRTAEARRHYEIALQRIEGARADLLRTSFKLSFLSPLIHFYQQYVAMLIAEGATARALEVVESSRARILASGGEARRRTDFTGLARRNRSVFLCYWLAPEKSALWAIAADGIHYFPLPPARQIEDLVESHHNAIRDLRDPLRSDLAASRRLFQVLVRPALPLLGRNPRVTMVLDGALHRLNFETLIDAEERYWIEDATISVAPSLATAERKLGPRSARGRSLLMIGDPEPASASFPKLKFAAAEMQGVEEALASYSRTVYRGSNAQPQAYRNARPSQFSVIHFATHADANAESPLDSSVVLSRQPDGFKLYASELAEIPLLADLVTISSCRSAGARSYAGEGLVGLAWAFLHAGARHVVAGLWDVNDASTTALMQSMYGHIASGVEDDLALRQAKLELLRMKSSVYRKPYYWGPFILYTAGN